MQKLNNAKTQKANRKGVSADTGNKHNIQHSLRTDPVHCTERTLAVRTLTETLTFKFCSQISAAGFDMQHL